MKRNLKRAISHMLSVIMLIAALLTSMTAFGVVEPQRADAASVTEISVGDHITIGKTDAKGYKGMPYWRVVDKDTDGNYLLLSEYLWTGDGSNAESLVKYDTVKKGKNTWQDSMPQEWCANFEKAVLENVEGLTIVSKTKDDPAYSYYESQYKTYYFDSYGNILQEGKDNVFFLSAEEAVKYFPSDAERKAYTNDNGTKNAEVWWTRSPEKGSLQDDHLGYAGTVMKNGKICSAMGWSGFPVRPAFWARLDKKLILSKTKNNDFGTSDWTIEGMSQTDVVPEDNKPTPNLSNRNSSITINSGTVNASVVMKAIKNAEANGQNVETLIIGRSAKKISKNAFKGTKVKTLLIKTKKLKKKSVKGALKGSNIKNVKVQVGSKKTNKKYIKKYKKIFTKKNVGRKVKVR